jgi:hypothetical protein
MATSFQSFSINFNKVDPDILTYLINACKFTCTNVVDKLVACVTQAHVGPVCVLTPRLVRIRTRVRTLRALVDVNWTVFTFPSRFTRAHAIIRVTWFSIFYFARAFLSAVWSIVGRITGWKNNNFIFIADCWFTEVIFVSCKLDFVVLY